MLPHCRPERANELWWIQFINDSAVASTTVTFTPTRADILGAGYLGLRARPFAFWFFVGLFIAVPLLSALVAGVASALGAPVSTWSIVELIVIPPIVMALFSTIPLMQVRGARSLQGAHTYQFSDTGIHLTGPGFDNQVEWSILTACYSFQPGLLFVSGNAPLITVPSRSLTASNKAELVRLLNAKGVQMRGAW